MPHELPSFLSCCSDGVPRRCGCGHHRRLFSELDVMGGHTNELIPLPATMAGLQLQVRPAQLPGGQRQCGGVCLSVRAGCAGRFRCRDACVMVSSPASLLAPFLCWNLCWMWLCTHTQALAQLCFSLALPHSLRPWAALLLPAGRRRVSAPAGQVGMPLRQDGAHARHQPPRPRLLRRSAWKRRGEGAQVR